MQYVKPLSGWLKLLSRTILDVQLFRVSCGHLALVIGNSEHLRGVASRVDDVVDVFFCASEWNKVGA